MVPDQRSYTWLWLCTGYAAIGYPVQLWTTGLHASTTAKSQKSAQRQYCHWVNKWRAPWKNRSRERKFPVGTFAPRSENTGERSPWTLNYTYKCDTYITHKTNQRKVPSAKLPDSEKKQRNTSRNVAFALYSLTLHRLSTLISADVLASETPSQWKGESANNPVSETSSAKHPVSKLVVSEQVCQRKV